MTTTEIIAWHKEMAEKLAVDGRRLISEGQRKLSDATAHGEMVSRLLSGSKPIDHSTNGAITGNVVTLDQIRGYLQKKGGRTVHLAKHFKVEEKVIERIVNSPNSGIEIAPRGWLKVASNFF